MYNKLILALFFLTFIYSCASKHEGEQKPTLLSNMVSITDNEDKGVKEILSVYGGYCEYGIEYTTSSTGKNSKIFELKLSKSELINTNKQLNKNSEMVASNVAYLFYKNLVAERKEYSKIRTRISFDDNIIHTTDTYEWPVTKLDTVCNEMNVVHKVIRRLKNKEYDSITGMISNSPFFPSVKDTFKTFLKRMDSAYGNIKEFIPMGFFFGTAVDSVTQHKFGFLHISGLLKYDRGTTQFSIVLDPAAKNDDIILMDYKL